MSTSTISSALSHFYYCLSNFKSPHFDGLTYSYDAEPLKYMLSQRKPNTVFMRMVDTRRGVYSIDNDSGFIEPSNMVHLKMGKYMEDMLTSPASSFRGKFLKPQGGAFHEGLQRRRKEPQREDYYHYTKVNNLVLRSQIDCRKRELSPGEEPTVFELKTRAACVLRYDIPNYIDYLDYRIVKNKGRHSSFEREYYDLIRGGFLKYLLQCKIGRMDGAFIAYHNTQRIFGFEYVKLQEMEQRVFGCSQFSNIIFQCSLTLLEKVLDYIIEDVGGSPEQQQRRMFKLGFYANEKERTLNIMVETFEDQKIYEDRFREIMPEYMQDPIDYYLSHRITP